jgi:hypothetical protein
MKKSRITSRHVARASLTEEFDLKPDPGHTRFARHSSMLATQAAIVALEGDNTMPEAMADLLFSNCSCLCPGLPAT